MLRVLLLPQCLIFKINNLDVSVLDLGSSPRVCIGFVVRGGTNKSAGSPNMNAMYVPVPKNVNVTFSLTIHNSIMKKNYCKSHRTNNFYLRLFPKCGVYTLYVHMEPVLQIALSVLQKYTANVQDEVFSMMNHLLNHKQ